MNKKDLDAQMKVIQAKSLDLRSAQEEFNSLYMEDASRQVRDCHSNYDMGLITSKELFKQLADIYTYAYNEMMEISYLG